MDLGVAGLASGFDWRSLVDQLTEAGRAPQKRLLAEQTNLNEINTAYTNLISQLEALKASLSSIQTSSVLSKLNQRSVASSNPAIATATVAAGTAIGSYTFNILQLATNSSQIGVSDVGKPLNPNSNVSNLTLSNAAFSTPIAAGTFTVNGQQITISTSDTLQQVFDKIRSATGGAISGRYHPVSTNPAPDDTIELFALGNNKINSLGSPSDTSNFLQVAKLSMGATPVDSVFSSSALGGIKLALPLNNANFTTAISDGGSGNGLFRINGVDITFNAATDSVTDVLNRINASGANVTATYDSTNDRFVLTHNNTGQQAITLQDVTGNFLAATQLSTGTFQAGTDLLFNVNGGPQLSNTTNNIPASLSGITGLNVTALQVGSTTFNVTSAVTEEKQDELIGDFKEQIINFLNEYNKTQKLLDTLTTTATDPKGNVTAGLLSTDGTIASVGQNLRKSLSSVLNQLSALGIDTNGNDHTLFLGDSRLDDALDTNFKGIVDLFNNVTTGLAATVGSFIDRTLSLEGPLFRHQDFISQRVNDIDRQIEDMERVLLEQRTQMIDSFVAMENVQKTINEQLAFLQRTLPPITA